ncbi:MAG: B12-binding domain-containing radical SAM protein, partial [Methanococcaceae archaeon]
MNILLVYPKYPETFWSFKHALKFISKKATFPPLGLLTVASMLPKSWNLKLVDMNVEALKDKEIINSDYVFLSAMSIQSKSAIEVIKKCNELKTKIVAGGPLFTSNYELFENIDHFVLDEAEITLPLFLEDLRKGHPDKIYRSEKWADITTTPLPDWKLAKLKKYSSMNIQYSRGCPFDCEFCEITVLYGRKPRT